MHGLEVYLVDIMALRVIGGLVENGVTSTLNRNTYESESLSYPCIELLCNTTYTSINPCLGSYLVNTHSMFIAYRKPIYSASLFYHIPKNIFRDYKIS